MLNGLHLWVSHKYRHLRWLSPTLWIDYYSSLSLASLSFFPLHFTLLFMLEYPPQMSLSVKVSQTSEKVCQALLCVPTPYHSVLPRHTLVFCLCIFQQTLSFFSTHLRKACNCHTPCWANIWGKTKTKYDQVSGSKCISQVTSGCKCEPPDSLVPVKTTLHKIPRCILALGSHISTLGSLDMSLSKALTAAEWEVWIEEGRESYTQDFEF